MEKKLATTRPHFRCEERQWTRIKRKFAFLAAVHGVEDGGQGAAVQPQHAPDRTKETHLKSPDVKVIRKFFKP